MKTLFTRLLNGIFIAITLGLAVLALGFPHILVGWLAFLEVQIKGLGNWNYLIAFSSSIIESFPVLGVFFPGQQIMLMAGGFFGKEHLPLMIFLASVGAIIGNFIGYILGKKIGKGFLKHHGNAFGVGTTELRHLERQIDKNGSYFVILGKFHNFTRAFVPFIAGASGMRSRAFFVYNIIGSILWATTILLLSVLFAQYYEKLVYASKYIMLFLLAAAALYIYFFKRKEFLSYLKEKEQEIEERTRHP